MFRMSPTRTIMIVSMIAFLPRPPVALAADAVPAIAAIPETLSHDEKEKFSKESLALQKQLSDLQVAAKTFNDKVAEKQTDDEFNAVKTRQAVYVSAVRSFNSNLAAAVDNDNLIRNMEDLAVKMGFSPDQQNQLDAALKKLNFDGDPNVTGTQISRTWETVIARGQDTELSREASQGDGQELPGAGTQTVFNDCTIFALANATGLTYGYVGARATELVHQAEWRTADQRSNPQTTLEKSGLNGGEVIMLAEIFGQAEVVPSKDFAKVIKDGHPIMVNVVPAGGDVRSVHEVVLTKAFQHGGETWFEMMDSNQGPQRRLFLSGKELNVMLQENGVAYKSDPGRTPQLLRKSSDR